MALSTVLPANSACLNGWQTAKYLKKNICGLVSDRDTFRKIKIFRPQGKVMFSQASVILSTISLMAIGSLLILVMVLWNALFLGLFFSLISQLCIHLEIIIIVFRENSDHPLIKES